MSDLGRTLGVCLESDRYTLDDFFKPVLALYLSADVTQRIKVFVAGGAQR